LKTLLAYFLAVLMLITSALYFAVAIFGERVESNEAHFLQLARGQTEGDEAIHNESKELTTEKAETGEAHNESEEIATEKLEETQGNAESTDHVESEEAEEEGTEPHQETPSENHRKMLELPLCLGAGFGYAAVGLWMILDRRNTKVPYLISIAGSLILLGFYCASRTVGIPSLGVEPVGLLDLIVAMLQGGIILGSSYVLTSRIYLIREY
jgi:hypothetical protein